MTPTTRPRARKRFGQHFLEPAWIDKVIRAIDPKPDEAFIEIGPGRGALTFPLAGHAKAVAAYEIDRDLAPVLQEKAPPNVLVIAADFLSLHLDDLSFEIASKVRVVGNLPYNVASPILFKLIDLSAASLPSSPVVDATVMVQREVADRLVARPGTREYGVLSVLVGHRSRVDRLLNLPPGAFRPRPKVSSSLLRLGFHAPDPPVRNPEIFAALVQAVFTRRRKTLANALRAYEQRGEAAELSSAGVLEQAGLDGRRRPETLTIGEFGRLADVYADGAT